MNKYDVIIIGGGISGIITALALSEKQINCALIEIRSLDEMLSHHDDKRGFAII
jgi:2-polyprenyl-6-methoxyphenol hydroxylase-like FAD-dependent oxidoreductase